MPRAHREPSERSAVTPRVNLARRALPILGSLMALWGIALLCAAAIDWAWYSRMLVSLGFFR